MKFNYYYGNQADQFSFIRIPRVLLVAPLFSPLSIQAKLLYGVFLDRMGISMRNGWFDEKNRVYIIYQIAEIQEDLGFSRKKALDHLTELEQFGLVEKKSRGRGLPNILYIKSFMSKQDAAAIPEYEGAKIEGSSKIGTSEHDSAHLRSAAIDTSEDDSYDLRSAEIDTSKQDSVERFTWTDAAKEGESAFSREQQKLIFQEGPEAMCQEVLKSTLLEVPKSTHLKNYNNKNKTYESNIQANHISSSSVCEEIRCDAMTDIMRSIKAQIEYDDLIRSDSMQKDMIDSVVDIMLEVAMNQRSCMIIASASYPTELVRERFRKLDSGHIQYVLDCFSANTTRVGNIKKYLMTALFNAPVTIEGYYTAAVHHDMPYLALAKTGG